MGIAIIQPSRVRRVFNGWCHGLFAGQHFNRALNLGCGHDQDHMGYAYSGYFDAAHIVRLDKEQVTTYPPAEIMFTGSDRFENPVDVIADAELLPFSSAIFDMVFCNWVIYHTHYVKVFDEIRRVLVPGGKLLVTYMDECIHGPIYMVFTDRFRLLSYCLLQMDMKLDGRDWIAEGCWGEKK